MTCGSNHCVDFRIPGIPHSAVEKVETNRKATVKRLVEQFGNHPNRNMLLKDFEKSEEITHFRQESNDMIAEMGNDEIFEINETSSKRQCRDCALCWKLVSYTAHAEKCVQPTEKSRQFKKDRFDILSIPGYVMKKNLSRGARHGRSLRQTVYHKARDMLRQAKKCKEWSLPNYS